MGIEITKVLDIVEGKITEGEITSTFKVSKDGGKVVLMEGFQAVMNLSGVEIEELVKMAEKSIRIKYQGQLRTLSADLVKKESGKTLDVAEFLRTQAVRTYDPAKGVLNKIDKGEMSEDQIQDLIKQLQEKVAK